MIWYFTLYLSSAPKEYETTPSSEFEANFKEAFKMIHKEIKDYSSKQFQIFE